MMLSAAACVLADAIGLVRAQAVAERSAGCLKICFRSGGVAEASIACAHALPFATLQLAALQEDTLALLRMLSIVIYWQVVLRKRRS